jgi:hypothetical protein
MESNPPKLFQRFIEDKMLHNVKSDFVMGCLLRQEEKRNAEIAFVRGGKAGFCKRGLLPIKSNKIPMSFQ